jgi:hypothetical protein
MKTIKYFFGFILFSLLISLVLFYMDEGRYSFDAILTIGNLVPLLVLIILSSSIAMLFNELINRIYNSKYLSLFITVLIGYPIGFFISFTILILMSKTFVAWNL